VNANVEETAGAAVAARNRRIVVHLDTRASEPVAIGGASETLGLQLEAHDEVFWIDDSAESARCLRRFRQSCDDVR